jgi:hypothetical protein
MLLQRHVLEAGKSPKLAERFVEGLIYLGQHMRVGGA